MAQTPAETGHARGAEPGANSSGWRQDSRRENLVAELADSILLSVMMGEYPPGTRLRQERLAFDFGVSRTPIREALRKLEAIGIVEMVPRRGAVVRRVQARDVREAYQVRAALEGLAAELAAKWITDEELVRLREAEELFRSAVDQFRKSKRSGRLLSHDDSLPWSRSNDLFHEAVLGACRNRQLTRSITELHQRFPRNLTWSALTNDLRLLELNVTEHAEILAAIDARDSSRACQLMRDHIMRSGELIAMHLEQL